MWLPSIQTSSAWWMFAASHSACCRGTFSSSRAAMIKVGAGVLPLAHLSVGHPGEEVQVGRGVVTRPEFARTTRHPVGQTCSDDEGARATRGDPQDGEPIDSQPVGDRRDILGSVRDSTARLAGRPPVAGPVIGDRADLMPFVNTTDVPQVPTARHAVQHEQRPSVWNAPFRERKGPSIRCCGERHVCHPATPLARPTRLYADGRWRAVEVV